MKFNQNRFLFPLIQKEGFSQRETIQYVSRGSTPYYEFSQGGTKKGHIKISDDTDKIRWYLNKIGERYTTHQGYNFLRIRTQQDLKW